MAAPHVAGLAALIWGARPALTAAQVRAQIRNTAVDLGTAGRDIKFGYGRIDAGAALLQLPLNPAATQEAEPPEVLVQAPFIPGEILIKPAAGQTLANVLGDVQTAGVRVADQIPPLGVYKLVVPVGQEAAWVARLGQDPAVAYAELNYVVRVH